MNTSAKVILSETDKKLLSSIDANYTKISKLLGPGPMVFHEFDIVAPPDVLQNEELESRRLDIFSGIIRNTSNREKKFKGF